MPARLVITCLFFYVIVSPLGASEFETVIQPFFEKHCINCQGPDKAKSGVRSDRLAGVIADEYAAEDWQGVLDVMLAGGGPRHGAHYRYNADEGRLADLWLGILKHSGCPVDAFADSAGPLTEMFG